MRCRRLLRSDIAHSASPVSSLSSVHITAEKGVYYRSEKWSTSTPHPPLTASVCVCVLAWPNMCAESGRQEGVHHWGMCTCNFSHLTQLVFCRVSGIRKCLWKLWLLTSASPPFQLLKKRDIFTMVFSISERVAHSADWPNRKKSCTCRT